jgi:hypothetical protein
LAPTSSGPGIVLKRYGWSSIIIIIIITTTIIIIIIIIINIPITIITWCGRRSVNRPDPPAVTWPTIHIILILILILIITIIITLIII